LKEDQIALEWKEKNSEYKFTAHQLPDGLLRFICLTTLLLQPKEMLPPFIIIDEPELGLHPFAITLLTEMLKSASAFSQILITTQSPLLLDQFDISDIRIVDRIDGSTKIITPNAEELKDWLEDYTVGELWKKKPSGWITDSGASVIRWGQNYRLLLKARQSNYLFSKFSFLTIYTLFHIP